MSKQPSNETKRNLLRRGLAGILLLAMLFGLLPSTVFTAHAASWADPYVETLVDWGVMRGDINGNMAPDRSITRAEFVAMMNRAYGYTNLGGHPFTDVRVQDWYNEDIDIGYNIGYFKGTSPTTASPNDTLTREQAAVLLARNMMLQPTVGETLGFSDSRSLSDWSRGLIGAAAAHGLISGYDDGSFQPFKNITRGEVAAMLVRAIGTPINTKGEHALGNVYGNVTVNTSGVKLRDGVIVGNLYLTGGIDLGEVLLENVTVLGEIIVSGGGESNSSAASIVMRNVTADNMIVDSISDQFVTIRAEGVTDIPTTTVRTNAYVDDSSLPGYGLSYIDLDGGEGTLLQLAGNVKEVWNRTPGSDLQVVQGSAGKITIDEKATGSTVLVDGDAQVDNLNLDVATTVTGTGDIKNLNVGAAGSTVEQLPDSITIRPGITSDIAGTNMNSTQAAESSADPKLLAGYPAVKKIAPTSATLVFKTNKTGTIYWAISAVADGSVKEEDLLEPPAYGGNVLKSGTIKADSANKEFTAAVTGLTKAGSYYVTAMLVDGRDQHSPIKVTSFTTPDDTKPAFNQGYPYMSKITTENSQVTVSTNKSCLLYYALLPKGSTAPTPAEFKANAISGNLGYGTVDAVKNVTQPFQVNSTRLKELTDYTLYLWLTDYDGAQSSSVTALNFKTPDEQAPIIVSADPTKSDVSSVDVTFVLNEAATLYWAVVPEGQHAEILFESISEEEWSPTEVAHPDDARLQIKIENGAGNAIAGASGSARVNAGYVNGKATVKGLDPKVHGTSTFTMYMVAKDAAGNYSKVQKITIRVKDNTRPTVELEFDPPSDSTPPRPSVTATAQLVFSEKVKGANSGDDFETLYRKVETSAGSEKADAMNAWAAALYKYIKLYSGASTGTTRPDTDPVKPVITECQYNAENNTYKFGTMVNGKFEESDDWQVNYCEAKLLPIDREGRMIIEFPAYDKESGKGALKLTSGTTYHFTIENIVDTSEDGNDLDPKTARLDFIISPAHVNLAVYGERPMIMRQAKLKEEQGGAFIFKGVTTAEDQPTFNPDNYSGKWPSKILATGSPNTGTSTYWYRTEGTPPQTVANNLPQRLDRAFTVIPDFTKDSVDDELCYDILIWSDRSMDATIYSRRIEVDANGKPVVNQNAPWEWEGVMQFRTGGMDGQTSVFCSLNRLRLEQDASYQPDFLTNLASDGEYGPREFAIHVEQLNEQGEFTSTKGLWDADIYVKATVVVGNTFAMEDISKGGNDTTYQSFKTNRGVAAISEPEKLEQDMMIDFDDEMVPEISATSVTPSKTGRGATIGFTMKNEGKVNYLIIRLKDVKYQANSTDTAYSATHTGRNDPVDATSIIGKIQPYTGYSSLVQVALKDETGNDKVAPAPGTPGTGSTGKIQHLNTTDGQGTKVRSPSADAVTEQTFGNVTDPDDGLPRIIKGTTDKVPGTWTTYINDLEGKLAPNTIYLIAVVPEGDTLASRATEAQCFYFTTNKAARPLIKLSGTWASEVKATVDMTSDVTGGLLVQSNIAGGAKTKFLMDTFTDHVDDILESGLTAAQKASTYTVLDALYDDCRTPEGTTDNGNYSVFDIYANEDTKSTLRQLLEAFDEPMVLKDVDDVSITVRSGTNDDTLKFDGKETGGLDPQQRYVCIGMAYCEDTNMYGFRAISNLMIQQSDVPVITSITPPDYNPTTGTMSGEILINFNIPLYVNAEYISVKPAAQSDRSHPTAIGTDGKYYGLGLAITFTNNSGLSIYDVGRPTGTGDYDESKYSQIQFIRLEIDKTGSNGQIRFSIDALSNGLGTTYPCSVVMQFDKTTGDYLGATVTPANGKDPAYELK